MSRKANTCRVLFMVPLVLAHLVLQGQNGELDPSFNAIDDGQFGDGFRYLHPFFAWDAPAVRRMHLDAQGNIVSAGAIDHYNCLPTNHVARMDLTGRVDITFTSVLSNGDPANDMVIQPDGRIIVVGNVLGVDGIEMNGVVRLLPDGSHDPSFLTGTGASGSVHHVVAWPDGSLAIAGSFTAFDGVPRGRIARLLPDGALDQGYANGSGVSDGAISALLPLPDGKLLIAGTFTQYNGTPVGRIARLMPDGQLDPTFQGAADAWVRAMAVTPDGDLWIGGNFEMVNGESMPRLARLQSDGTLAQGFASPLSSIGFVDVLRTWPDGSVQVSGNLIFPGGGPMAKIVRLMPNGEVHPLFQPIIASDVHIGDMLPLPDGRLAVCGVFHEWEGRPRSCLVVLLPDGSLDMAHNPARGVRGVAETLTTTPSGHVILGGSIRAYNDTLVKNLIRLTPDGGIDPSFDIGTGPSHTVLSVASDPEGRILVAGTFQFMDEVPVGRIARLLPGGAMDPSFQTGSGANGGINAVLIDQQGRILIGGQFTSFNGSAQGRIARLLPTGALDPSFDTGTGVGSGSSRIHALALLPDGKILAGGSFTEFGGLTTSCFVRLLPDGSRDPDVVHPVVSGNVHAVAVLPDGKVLVGGGFLSVEGQAVPRLCRLNVDGSLDDTFIVGTGPDLTVTTIEITDDDKILVGGWFSTFDGLPYSGMARLHMDGSVDTEFIPNSTGPYSARAWINAMHPLPSAQVLVAGQFCGYTGTQRHGIMRLNVAEGVGIPELSEDDAFIAYPNPTSDVLHFERSISGNIYDAQGRWVMSVPVGTRISVSGLATGLYVLHTASGQALRFMKE